MSTDLHDLVVVAIPTKTDFRGINVREAALFRGSAGWSEFSPFLEYDDRESATWLKAALEAANQPWPELKRTSIPINATLPRVAPDRVAEILGAFTGCTTIKIKVDNFEADRPLVAAALDYLPAAKIRLDVNGGWMLAEAISELTQFQNEFGDVFEYIEQPCESLTDLAILKQEVAIKIAVDESIRKNLGSNFTHLREIADVAIMKWAPSGGFAASKKLIDEIALPTVISSALDTGIGISHGLALAGSLDRLDYACGLGTVALLESDVATPALTLQNGALDVKRLAPDEALIAHYRASEDRQSWWKNRIQRIMESEGFNE
jgi:O-succinylbenzoate synthase